MATPRDLEDTPVVPCAENAHGYAATVDRLLLLSLFKTPSTPFRFWLSQLLKNTPCSRRHHRRVPTMTVVQQHLSLAHDYPPAVGR